MTVSYFYRTPTTLHSIERVFETVRGALGTEHSSKSVYCRFRRGFLGCLYNLCEARGRQSDINHITGDVHYLAFALNRKKTILTVHDCGTLDRLKGWRREVVRLLWFEWPVRRVAAVTVVSEASKTELMRWTSCPEAKIRVIANPLPSGYQPHAKAFCEPMPDILQVGTRVNKNLENSARALEGLPCQLSIVGSLSSGQTELLDSLKLRYREFPDLSDEDLLGVYRQADMVLFCSVYEGFGMPIIEGNAIGRPVIASDIEPIRSVANGSACLVDPHDSASIREGVQRVRSDAGYREELVRRGFANAARFEPRKIAEEYLSLYQEVLGISTGARNPA